ncbi:unnamed protein product, partial [Symbiodinium microadriaticum]
MEEDEEGLVDTSNGVGSATVMLEETSGDGEQPEEEVAAPLDPDQAFRNAMKAKAMDALLMLSAGSIEEKGVVFFGIMNNAGYKNMGSEVPTFSGKLEWILKIEQSQRQLLHSLTMLT